MGGRAVLTDPALPSGSDRIFAALRTVDPEKQHDVVVNLQGDLPALAPDAIRAVVEALAASGDGVDGFHLFAAGAAVLADHAGQAFRRLSIGHRKVPDQQPHHRDFVLNCFIGEQVRPGTPRFIHFEFVFGQHQGTV